MLFLPEHPGCTISLSARTTTNSRKSDSQRTRSDRVGEDCASPIASQFRIHSSEYWYSLPALQDCCCARSADFSNHGALSVGNPGRGGNRNASTCINERDTAANESFVLCTTTIRVDICTIIEKKKGFFSTWSVEFC